MTPPRTQDESVKDATVRSSVCIHPAQVGYPCRLSAWAFILSPLIHGRTSNAQANDARL